jgi:hypothetical protein
MIRNLIASLGIILTCFGCATDRGPKPTFQSGTRVGILNSLESTMTHRHITIDRMDSFEKSIDVDWKIPAYLDDRLAAALKKNGRFTVVPIVSPAIQSRLMQLGDQIDSAATRRRISRSLADFIDHTAKAHDLDVIIIVLSFKGESPWKIGSTPISLQGYGLFTRSTVLGLLGVTRNRAHAYAQFRVIIFRAQPAAGIGVGQPKMTKGNMKNFKWPADIKNVPRTELDKLRPKIEVYADEAVKNALADAHMDSP